MDKLEAARLYHEMGMVIIPVKNTLADRRALVPWKQYADCSQRPTLEQIEQWFTQDFPNAMIGVVLGRASNLATIDIDNHKNGDLQKGLESFKALYDGDYCAVKTPRKGFQMWFLYDEGLNGLGNHQNFEIKRQGHITIAPPSIREDGFYEWESLPFDKEDAEPFPQAVIEAVKAEKREAPAKTTYEHAEGSRNEALYHDAVTCFKAGDSYEKGKKFCFDRARLICDPPLTQNELAELERTIDSAWKTYGRDDTTEVYTGASVEVESSGTSVLFGGNINAPRPEHTVRFRSHADILRSEGTTEWIIEGLLPAKSMTLLFARGGMGKSTLATQIYMAIGHGYSFMGRAVAKTPAYYVDYENPESFLKTRLSNYEPSENSWLTTIVDDPPRIDSEDFVIFHQLEPGVILFDTLRSGHGQDENSTTEMMVVMDKLKALRVLGFTCIILHHTPKGSDDNFRGSTAIRDACDHMTSLTKVGQLTEDFDPDAIYRWGTKEKTRFAPGEVFMRLNIDTLSFEPANNPKEHLERRILTILETQGRQKKNSLVELTEYSESAVEKATRKLRKEDRIKTIKDGRFVFFELKAGGVM